MDRARGVEAHGSTSSALYYSAADVALYATSFLNSAQDTIRIKVFSFQLIDLTNAEDRTEFFIS